MRRLTLILGKYPVVSCEKRFDGWKVRVRLGEAYAEFTNIPSMADIRVGDVLTLYTQVASNAKPLLPPKQ